MVNKDSAIIKARKHDYYVRNKEQILARCAVYRATNPEKVAAAIKLAKAKHPEKYRKTDNRWHREHYHFNLEQSRIEGKAKYYKYAEQNRQYRILHRMEIRARVKKWQALNPVRDKAMHLAYSQTHRIEAIARAKAWIKLHPEQSRLNTNKRRALQRGNLVGLTWDQ